MNNLWIAACICLLTLPALASAAPDYLVRIDRVDQAAVDQLRSSGIEVYAKATGFWIAGAAEDDLQRLAQEGVPFQILDEEPEAGEHYFVQPRPGETIQSCRLQIEARCHILMSERDVALVKGNSRRIEELADLGFSLRKIRKQALPIEPEEYVPTYLRSLSAEHDPLIDTIVNRVDQTCLLAWIDDLSGEDTVTIAGAPDSIKTRYSYNEGCGKAGIYLKERFEQMELPVELDSFQVGSGPPGTFTAIACSPYGQKAWAVGRYTGIAMTIDGGGFWSTVSGSQEYTLLDVCRVDDDTLWSVGYSGVILRSMDGGDTWDSRSKPEFASLNFWGCYFEDAHSGWVVGVHKILFTDDGGVTWTEQAHVPGLILTSLDFAGQYRGWAVGTGGKILHTSDRGANWNQQLSPTSIDLQGVDFIDSLSGWAVGLAGTALRTTSGGLIWIQEDLSTGSYLTDVEFVDDLRGWIVGSGNILHTSDSGVNWIHQQSVPSYLQGVDFGDTLLGWACGSQNCVVKTVDGGQNWFESFEVDSLDLFNVVATIGGAVYPGRQVLITGHYDDVSENPSHWAPGADDNASGTVSLLAAADILKNYGLINTVKFLAFSAEEQGHLGSLAYVEAAYDRGDTILAVLNFDMIAYDGNDDRVIEVHCGDIPENQALADILVGAIGDYALDLAPEKQIENPSWSSDHASFWEYDFPAILAGEDHQDFNPYYHTTADRVSAFDTTYYAEFIKAAVASLAVLAGPFMLGDANGDALMDLGDVVYLLNFLFKGGLAPDPLQAGDANSDGTVEPGDAIYLLNYLFKGGPPPSS
jgi:photosystem II stability/assembly factor-like uncharacterized protein